MDEFTIGESVVGQDSGAIGIIAEKTSISDSKIAILYKNDILFREGETIISSETNISAIVINPGAFTHTSIAIRDALSGVEIPFYEVHISDINNREDFRKFSYLSDIAKKVFSGQGLKGYELALNDAIKNNLEK
ncbi:MAG: 3-dehydroquinate dehydratase [Proteobacteria bacterium]|nr:3-dehydroquinate dehydratase [Pseudomonadota bacterium]